MKRNFKIQMTPEGQCCGHIDGEFDYHVEAETGNQAAMEARIDCPGFKVIAILIEEPHGAQGNTTR